MNTLWMEIYYVSGNVQTHKKTGNPRKNSSSIAINKLRAAYCRNSGNKQFITVECYL